MTRQGAALAAAFAVLLLAACRPDTTRPAFAPVPDALNTELDLPVSIATRTLADAITAESLTVSRVEIRDGFLESPWLDARTGRPTRGRRLGPDVVRLRGWVDPSRPGHSDLTVEAVYRPLADPSLPERELEREVPADHPIAKRLAAMMDTLTKKFGDPSAVLNAAPKPDSTAPRVPAKPAPNPSPKKPPVSPKP